MSGGVSSDDHTFSQESCFESDLTTEARNVPSDLSDVKALQPVLIQLLKSSPDTAYSEAYALVRDKGCTLSTVCIRNAWYRCKKQLCMQTSNISAAIPNKLTELQISAVTGKFIEDLASLDTVFSQLASVDPHVTKETVYANIQTIGTSLKATAIQRAWYAFKRRNPEMFAKSALQQLRLTIFPKLLSENPQIDASEARMKVEGLNLGLTDVQITNAWHRFSLSQKPKKHTTNTLPKSDQTNEHEIVCKILKECCFVPKKSYRKLGLYVLRRAPSFSHRSDSQLGNMFTYWCKHSPEETYNILTSMDRCNMLRIIESYIQPGMEFDEQCQIAIDLQGRQEFRHHALHGIYDIVKECCTALVCDRLWGPHEEEFLAKYFQNTDIANIEISHTVDMMKQNENFRKFTTKKLTAVVKRLCRNFKATLALNAKSLYQQQEWSAEHNVLFAVASSSIKLDLRASNLKEWTKKLCRAMNGIVPARDIMDRLHRTRWKILQQEGVYMDCQEPQLRDLDYVITDNSEEKKHSIHDGMCAFLQEKYDGPDLRCGCCGKLEFRSSMRRYTNKLHARLAHLPDVQKTLNYMTVASPHAMERHCCYACIQSLQAGKAPHVCCGIASPFNTIPKAVQNLSDLEATLVAPRLAFTNIKQLRFQQQRAVRGAIVFVPTAHDTTQKILPRSTDACDAIHVELKRKLEYKHAYKTGNVRPAVMYEALQILRNTPLYVQEKVRLKSLTEIETEAAQTLDNLAVNISIDCDPRCNAEDTMRTPHLLVDAQKAHKDADGDLIISDDEDVYLDETDPKDDVVPVQTCLVDELSAHELRERVLQLAPCQGQKPIQLLFDEYGEELCYPKLFGGHPRSVNTPSKLMIHRNELRNADRRFANNIENIFLKYRMSNIRSVLSAANISIRMALNGSVTAGQILNPYDANFLVAHDLGFVNLKQLRGSPDYKQTIKRELFAMIRQLGKPTWFLTLSAADTKWLELIMILHAAAGKGRINKEQADAIPVRGRAEMIANDPVTCARYYNRRVARFLSGVIRGTLVLGDVNDHAGVDEFQARGTPHTHILLWCNNSPQYQKNNYEDVIEHIDQYITTDTHLLPGEMKELQTHNHSKRCAGHHRACCFGFPMPPMMNTYILDPLDISEVSETELAVIKDNCRNIKNALRAANKNARKARMANEEVNISTSEFIETLGLTEEEYLTALRYKLLRPTLYLKRRVCDIMINGFNVDILCNWQANMDIQPVLDEYAAAMYVASYISKSQRGMSNLLSKIQKESFPNSSAMLKRMGSAYINASEVCAQEAVYHVLGLPLRRFSRVIQFVNTSPSETRYRMAKRSADLQQMVADETDIFHNSAIDRYAVRDNQFDTGQCLADEVACYKWTKRDIDEESVSTCSFHPEDENIEDDHEDRGKWVKSLRNKPKVLRFVNVSRSKDFEAYCREKVLLFSAWRGCYVNPFDDCVSWAACFAERQQEIKRNAAKYSTLDEEAWETAVEEAICCARNAALMETSGDEGDEMWDKADLNNMESMPVTHQYSKDLLSNQNKTRFVDAAHFGDKLSKLNGEQTRIFQHVLYNVTRTVKSEPLRLFITGGAGVGKSTVIDAITQAVTQHFNYDANAQVDTLRVLLMAPTGKAAFQIAAYTLHAALAIPPNQKGNQLCGLKGEKLSSLQFKFSTLKLVIVDEVSMLGRSLYDSMDRRLRQIMCRDELFGGLHVIFVGDFFQLAPVMDTKLFTDVPGKPNSWKEKFSMFELTEIMRQKGDQAFAAALNRLREGLQTFSDNALFSSRIVSRDLSLTYMFAFNALKDEFNTSALTYHTGSTYIFKAIDTLSTEYRNKDAIEKTKQHISKMELKHTQSLMQTLEVKKGMPVELTMNLDVPDGLCNGTAGTVHEMTGSGQDTILWLEFQDPAIGKAARSNPAVYALQDKFHLSRKFTPIRLVTKEIFKQHGARFFRRTQFPLVLACGVTVHHCQGSTFRKVGVDLSKHIGSKKLRIGDGMVYTAYSRSTTLDGLHLMNFDEADIRTDREVMTEMQRLRTYKRVEENCPMMQMRNASLCIYNHNVRSFRKHGKNIVDSLAFRCAHISFFQETRCEVSKFLKHQSKEELNVIEIAHRPQGEHGIAFVSKNECRMTELYRAVQPKGVELLCVQVVHELTVYVLIGLYNPPNNNLQNLLYSLQFLGNNTTGDHRIVVGDFNINAGAENSSDMKHLQKLMSSFNLHLAQCTDTRICGDISSRIDHVWSSAACETTVEIGYTCLSDHMPMHIYVKLLEQIKREETCTYKTGNKRVSKDCGAASVEPTKKIKTDHQSQAVTKTIREVPDLSCLHPGQWLNDEVINATVLLLQERNSRRHVGTSSSGSYFFNSFFFVLLAGHGGGGYQYETVRNWTSQRSLQQRCIQQCTILQFDKIIAPVHLDNHWTLAVADLVQQSFFYYDSFKNESHHTMHAFQRYIRDEYKDKLNRTIDTSSWPIRQCRYEKNIPTQTNGSDCGVFALFFAKFSADSAPFTFSQDGMLAYRRLLTCWISEEFIP